MDPFSHELQGGSFRGPSGPPPGHRSGSEVGAADSPELEIGELQAVEIEALEPRFELEGVRLDDAELGSTEAGSGRIEQALLTAVGLDGAKLRGVRMVDVRGGGSARPTATGAAVRSATWRSSTRG